MRRRGVLHLGLGLVTAAVMALVSGCLSPTLPLPPPEEPDTMQPTADPEIWIVAGTCQPGARVTVFNEQTHGGGVDEDDDQDGRYTVELRATACDRAEVSQVLGDDASGETTFVIQERNAAGVKDPSACK